MTSVVLSIGSNMGDRAAHLQSVVDGLISAGATVTAISPVVETDAWGGVEQEPFLNAVVLADDPDRDGPAWLALAHRIEDAAHRVRAQRWGPRTLDVDLVAVRDGGREVTWQDATLTLPHPYAHVRAFVLTPWLAADPDATLTVDGRMHRVAQLLDAVDPGERAGIRPSTVALRSGH